MFAELGRQLEGRRLIVRSGTLIDATLAAAAVKPPKGNAGEVSERDPEAGWTKKNGKSHFGYKAHIALDEGSEIIREAILTAADMHDSQPAALAALRTQLAAAGIEDRVMYRAARNTPLKSCRPNSTRRSPASAPASSAALR